ncbi:MAG: Y-family DNA polymerase [Ferruginibacter sp.]
MIAIVDCNSFYCSCERLFKPHLDNQPVVVLSNNDGCIVSRTDEAKKLGVEMAGPYFLMKPLIEKFGVHTFSSNYNLYGDLSWRVMETMRMLVGKDRVEVYSVDEAFIDLEGLTQNDWFQFALQLRLNIEQWTGIKVSIGVAPTKVLAKVANRLAKKNKDATQCVMVLDSPETITDALAHTPIADVWGIGRRYAEKLREMNAIYTALDLSFKREEWARQHLGGVVGVRLLRELKGVPSTEMKDELVVKKMIATTRMFGKPVNNLTDIKEAVATYTSRAAEKLRRQKSAATTLYVFVVTKVKTPAGERFRHGASKGAGVTLPLATAATQELIKQALLLVQHLYEPGTLYAKAGVVLSGIIPDAMIQGNLFVEDKENKNRKLMDMVDNINFSMRNDILKFAASGTKRNWKMRQELRSPRYTTRWDEMMVVR